MSRAVLLLLWCAAPVRAGTFGFLSVQGQGHVFSDGQRTSASLLLQENLGIHYAGMPFGPTVATLGAGLEATNVNALTPNGVLLGARSATLDLSVGLLPRRALPLRLFVRGTVVDGGNQLVPTLGGRESLAYGASVNLEPGGLVPGVRLDAEEHRFTGVGATAPLGDLRRVLSTTVYKGVGAHQLQAVVHLQHEQRALLGQWLGLSGTLSWSGPAHQSTVLGSWLERSLDVQGQPWAGGNVLPGGARALTERQLRLSHRQRWTPRFFSDVTGRLSDARFAGGVGVLGSAGLSAEWRPFEREELSFSAGGDVGFTETRSGELSSTSQYVGATARAGYTRPFGFVKPGLFVGGSLQECGTCAGRALGSLASFDAGASAMLLGFQRVDVLADYRLALVRAPTMRGGDRTEHHARVTGRVRVRERHELLLLAAYDDGVRDYVDVLGGGVAGFHERTFTGGAGASVPLWRGSAFLDVRHARGTSGLLASSFSAGPPTAARAITQVNGTVWFPVRADLDLTANALGSWTSLDDTRPLSTLAFSAGATFRLGRISTQLSYQLSRADTLNLITTQHFLRLSLNRPFEF